MQKILSFRYFFYVAIAAMSIWAIGCITELGLIKGSGNITTEHSPARDFKGINARDAVELVVTIANDYSVDIEADDNILPYIQTTIDSDRILKIGMENGHYSNTTIRVKISMPVLEVLNLHDAVRAEVSGVNASSLYIKLSDASKLRITGSAQKIICKVRNAAFLDAEKLHADEVNIRSADASHCKVYADSSIHIKSSDASRVAFFGNPKQVIQESRNASSISKE
jgi:hypothetical protein